MPESNTSEMVRKPDNTTTVVLFGTEFTVCEYFDGKKTLEEILVQRILQDQDRGIMNPSISNPLNG